MLVKNELFICETLASCRKREWPFMHLENRELSIYVSFASWHVRILLRNTLRMEKALDKHWYWYWYFGSSLLNTDFISTFILLSFFFNQVPFPLIPRLLTKDSGHQLLYFWVDPSDSVQSHCVYACAATEKKEIQESKRGTKIFLSS